MPALQVRVDVDAPNDSSRGGYSRRRMFTINCTERYRGPNEIEILKRELRRGHATART